MDNILNRYGEFLGKRPAIVVAFCIMLLFISNIGSSLITQSVTDFSEQIPEDLESIQTFEFVGDEFGETGFSVIFAVEIEPEYRDSQEARDVREPDVMAYLDLLAEKARTLDQVTGVQSAADLLKFANQGKIPRDKERIKEIIKSADEGFLLEAGAKIEALSFLGQTEAQLEGLEQGLEFQQGIISQIASGLGELGPGASELQLAASALNQSNLGILAGIAGLKAGVIEAREFVSMFGVVEVEEISTVSPANPFAFVISPDNSVAAVRITYDAADDAESREVVDALLQISDETPPPRGVRTTLTGGPVTNIVLNRTIGPTFAITGMLSFIGIFIVVVLIFYSLRYGLTSLLAIIFGSAWAFGFAGFTGLSLTPETSGALSLILGIGIDFGIQVVTRFRQELRRLRPGKAIARTMPNVIPPMTISAMAIVLGFKSLSFGQLPFIEDLGNIMALGVVMSYLAAITVVPAVLVVLNTFSLKSLRPGK